jgi:predicted HTH transcriptional regulator
MFLDNCLKANRSASGSAKFSIACSTALRGSSSKWATLTECSQDTASRDIDDVLKRNILVKDAAGGRSTSYLLAPMK